MECKKCQGKKLIKFQGEKISPYKILIEYVCVDCNATSYKIIPSMNALYTTEKFNV